MCGCIILSGDAHTSCILENLSMKKNAIHCTCIVNTVWAVTHKKTLSYFLFKSVNPANQGTPSLIASPSKQGGLSPRQLYENGHSMNRNKTNVHISISLNIKFASNFLYFTDGYTVCIFSLLYSLLTLAVYFNCFWCL